MYATDVVRQTSDVRQHYCLMHPPREWGIKTVNFKITHCVPNMLASARNEAVISFISYVHLLLGKISLSLSLSLRQHSTDPTVVCNTNSDSATHDRAPPDFELWDIKITPYQDASSRVPNLGPITSIHLYFLSGTDVKTDVPTACMPRTAQRGDWMTM